MHLKIRLNLYANEACCVGKSLKVSERNFQLKVLEVSWVANNWELFILFGSHRVDRDIIQQMRKILQDASIDFLIIIVALFSNSRKIELTLEIHLKKKE